MLDVPDSLLAERRRLGHDRFDEMWEGELHLVPPPSGYHQRLALWLAGQWGPLAGNAGLEVILETGLFDPAVADFSSYRQPDIALYRPEYLSRRGIEGRAELVVEIRSPEDESYEKIPFYERVGVAELLIIETDYTVNHWLRVDRRLVQELPDVDGWAQLRVLPMSLRGLDLHLTVRVDGEEWDYHAPG